MEPETSVEATNDADNQADAYAQLDTTEPQRAGVEYLINCGEFDSGPYKIKVKTDKNVDLKI